MVADRSGALAQIDQVPEFYGLIFCQTKLLVTTLTDTLKSHGYPVDCLHGDMEQNTRERTMKSFKAKTVTVLVCTDVASRGIDVKELTHVINYSLPRELDLCVHRIGRTGRGGKEGHAACLSRGGGPLFPASAKAGRSRAPRTGTTPRPAGSRSGACSCPPHRRTMRMPISP